MELTFLQFNKIVLNHELTPLYGGGVSKIIEGYTCRPNGGEAITGNRYEIPEFVINNGSITVTTHHLVLPSDMAFYHLWDCLSAIEAPRSWAAIEPNLSLLGDSLLHRSKKSNISLSRFITSLAENQDSAKIGRATAEIELLVRCEPEELEVEMLGGRDIIRWYENHNDDSHSCMTGNNAEFTELWSTNRNQIRLAVFSDSTGEIGRCLVMRPGADEGESDDLPFGVGWYFGRMYYVRTAYAGHQDRCVGFCLRKGLLEWGHVSSRDAMIPLRVTEYAPYIDRGSVYVKSKSVGALCYYLPPYSTRIDGLENDGYREIDSNQYGTAFGRNRDPDVYCCSCEERYHDDEDFSHVENYGSVCSGCIDSGDFYWCVDDTWRTHEDSYRIVAESITLNAEYAPTNYRNHRTYNHVTHTTDVTRFCYAMIDHDEYGLAPASECVEASEGGFIWKRLIDDGTVQVVTKALKRVHSGWSVEDIGTAYMPAETLLKVKLDSGEIVYADASSAVSAQEARLLNLHRLIVDSTNPYLRYATGSYALVDGEGGQYGFYRIGNEAVVLDYRSWDRVCVHATTTATMPVGTYYRELPRYRLSFNSTPISFGPHARFTMHTLSPCITTDTSFYLDNGDRCGYNVTSWHPSDCVTNLLFGVIDAALFEASNTHTIRLDVVPNLFVRNGNSNPDAPKQLTYFNRVVTSQRTNRAYVCNGDRVFAFIRPGMAHAYMTDCQYYFANNIESLTALLDQLDEKADSELNSKINEGVNA